MYVQFKPNGRYPLANVEMTVDRDEEYALFFDATDPDSESDLGNWYIEEPAEIEQFFAEVRRLEAEYRQQTGRTAEV